jgi:hypothetical protein
MIMFPAQEVVVNGSFLLINPGVKSIITLILT